MRTWNFALAILQAALMIPELVLSQDYPNKPIRIVTSGVGGGNDFAARLIAPGIADGLGQPVIVENRPSVTIAAEVLAHAQPDGYSMIFSGSPLWIGPLMQKVSYNAIKDFSPIALVVSTANVLVVNPSLAVGSVKELIALAKARPGELNCGAGAIGSTPHLAMELFKSMAGVDILRVNFKSSGPAVTSLIGGEVQLMFATSGSVAAHIKFGRLKAIAVTTAKPSALFPDLPTVAASGLPGYESSSPFGMFAPAGTPKSIVNRLNQEILRVLDKPDVKERFLSAGVETVGSSPQQLAATLKSEIAKLGKVILAAGIRSR